jgi:hypothetical protein
VTARLTADAPGLDATLRRLADEDVVGQLLERRGRMAELAEEGGDVKLDWVDQLAWLHAHPEKLDAVERVVADLRAAGIRHLVWAGMGGSVQAVRSLRGLGAFDAAPIAIHPLDSTDPAALNRLLYTIAGGRPLSEALAETAMVAVAMGMTSEEPITHLEWFDGLLRERRVPDPAAHAVVMALPGSLLDEHARRAGARRLPIQSDGQSHVPGRMSAPSTHVFLLAAALALRPGDLRTLVTWVLKEVPLAPGLALERRAALTLADPFPRLAAWLHAHLGQGRDMVLLDLAPGLESLGPWVEQVVEESLGKRGRGLLVFCDQDLDAAAAWPDRFVVLRVDGGTSTALRGRPLAALDIGFGAAPLDRLAAAARFFTGWNLAVAVLGYLEGIVFAGQPAVEGYKRYTRELRERDGPLPFPEHGLVTSTDGTVAVAPDSLAAAGVDVAAVRRWADARGRGPAAVVAAAIAAMAGEGRLGYLDVTLNADPHGPLWEALRRHAGHLSGLLRRPVKLRSGPRDYHSTEQSETDGPPDLLSLRILVREIEPVAAGRYTARFLHAQALGTVAAMGDAGRAAMLIVVRRRSDVDAVEALLSQTAVLRAMSAPGPR